MSGLPGFSEFHSSYKDIQHPVFVAGNGPAIILLHATPLYDDDGGCYPATNSEAESLAYIRCVKNTIAGSYVFRFLDYGYQGDDSVKNLETQSCVGL
ncbi:MAG: hypothetical protein RH862_12630 [Leptospiraceae bacterium]